MLYLIKEFGKENKEYLKIGKADNINKRMQQYNTDCAEFELIDSFEGSLPEEGLLHSFLNKYKVKGEWMEYNEEIILLWKLYKEMKVFFNMKIIQKKVGTILKQNIINLKPKNIRKYLKKEKIYYINSRI